MPIHEYKNWNTRQSDNNVQIEPYRKYFIICEGANTEVFYFEKLIDLRKELGIHPLIDIRLLEKTEKDRNISFPKNLFKFAQNIKEDKELFDIDQDKLIIVFDGDIFEEKVSGYEELISDIEENDIAAVSNPNFELFLCLHIDGFYKNYIKGKESKFLEKDNKNRYSYAEKLLKDLRNINPKKNPKIGDLASNIGVAIIQEKRINQDIHNIKGKVSSNIASIIDMIIKENPKI